MMEGGYSETEHVPTLAEDPALGLSRPAKMEILFAVMLGLFLGALDQTIVGPALPTIVTQLAGNDLYVWAVTIYLLTSTITVPIYGKLSDLYGRRPLLLIGIVLFLVGSALSGLSQTMWQLILFRGLQGLGAGALFPIALAVIGDLFTPAERGKYQGLFGAVFGIAFIVGPGLGGFLTDNFSWHWVFFVNLPIGLVALAVIGRLLPNIKGRRRDIKIDYLGVVTLVAGLVPILVGLTLAETSQWSDPAVWGSIVVGVVFLVVFVVVEGRAAEPIIPLHLFRNRTFSASMVAIFLATFGFGAAIIFLPLYFQIVEGSSATASGYKLLPFLFGLIISSIASGQIVSRTGRYKGVIVGGLAILAIGLYLMSFLRADTSDLVLSTVDVRGRLRRRADLRRLHDHRPELGALPRAGHGHQRPDPVPPDRDDAGADPRVHVLPGEPDLESASRPDRGRRGAGGPGADEPTSGLRPELTDLGDEHRQSARIREPAAGAVPGRLRPGLPPGVHDRHRELDAARGGPRSHPSSSRSCSRRSRCARPSAPSLPARASRLQSRPWRARRLPSTDGHSSRERRSHLASLP